MIKILRFIKQYFFLPAFRKAGFLLFGYDITTVGERLDVLQKKHEKLQRLFDLSINDPDFLWLYKNRFERMDATLDIFDENRRKFHTTRYKFAAQFVKDRNVADIACGTGYGTELLLVEGNAHTVVGVDISREAAEYAKAHHMPLGVTYICAPGDDTKLPPESVDVVVSFETIEHVQDDKALIAEFYRLLKHQGLLICSTPNDWPIESAPYHVRTYTKDDFKTLLSAYFTGIELYNQNSGSDTPFNHGQPAGINRTTAENEDKAECFISVCKKN